LLRQRPGPGGFTLLELLVVIFIIGLMSGYVVLSIDAGGRERSLDQESRRLHGLLRLAAQEAVLQGREVGVLLYLDRYAFVTSGLTAWEPPDDGTMLQPRQLPIGWRLELIQDGQVVPPLSSLPEQKLGRVAPTPQLIFYSSGEGTAFQLRIYADGEAGPYLIQGDESGMLELVAVKGQP
jgi:general secretion pathway protein H